MSATPFIIIGSIWFAIFVFFFCCYALSETPGSEKALRIMISLIFAILTAAAIAMLT